MFSSNSLTSRYCRMPVPAGIRWPMITFSFSPLKRSADPAMEELVSTRVVSWNEAAEMKESMFREARVMPSSSGCATAGWPPSRITLLFSSLKVCRSTCWP